MKILIITLLLTFQVSMLFGQVTEVEKCGLNNDARINNFEANYFNEVYSDQKGEFDFTGKVIAFYTGSAGTTESYKSSYFNTVKSTKQENNDIHAWQANGTQLLILTAEEKELSGGYDAILVSWSKILKEGKSRAKLVKSLKNAF